MERVRFSTDCLNGSEHLDIRLVFPQVLVYEVLELLVQLKVIGKQKPLLSSLFQNQDLQPRESLNLNSLGDKDVFFFLSRHLQSLVTGPSAFVQCSTKSFLEFRA